VAWRLLLRFAQRQKNAQINDNYFSPALCVAMQSEMAIIVRDATRNEPHAIKREQYQSRQKEDQSSQKQAVNRDHVSQPKNKKWLLAKNGDQRPAAG